MIHGIGHWYVESEKQAFWRGNPHTWVNRYVMSGADPSASDAETVMTDIHDVEDQLHANVDAANGIGFVQLRAYGSAGGPPFATVPYNLTKEKASSTGFGGAQWTGHTQGAAPTLETCQLLETTLSGLSTTGKPVYLRKYYRGVTYGGTEDYSDESIGADDVSGIEALTTIFQTGIGSGSWVVIGTSGKQASAAPVCHPFLVAHQIPRGKKKKS